MKDVNDFKSHVAAEVGDVAMIFVCTCVMCMSIYTSVVMLLYMYMYIWIYFHELLRIDKH
jgi:hypothetical protein